MAQSKGSTESHDPMLTINIDTQLGELALHLNIRLPMQGITAIFGRSGAGKTSLINIIGGLLTPDSGEIILADEVLFNGELGILKPPEKRQIGYVFQDARLFPHYSVRGNLNYGNKDTDSAHFDRVVKLLGLEHTLKRYPASLSGGEKQRVAIGRALLTRPKMLLMDEPLASLDLPRKRELIPYLIRLAKELKLPIIYVSHSLDEILQLAQHMLVLDQGKIIANGPLQEVWDSEQMRPWLDAKEQSSLLDVTVAETHDKYPMTRLALSNDTSLWVNNLSPEPGTRLKVRIHANHVSLCRHSPKQTSIRNIIPVRVCEVFESVCGENVQIKLAIAGNYLWANITPWARDDLQIVVGLSLFAQIKSVSLTESDLASDKTQVSHT
ncbi:molybdenum ABC transporter ATP-binding protein ModC [Shewanella benthica]|nr:molybdenum ABC transporter ATP-binding protein ModC [Shewanella benthica]